MSTTKAKGLEELFSDTLKDIYYAEKQILRALPKMAKSASSGETGVRRSKSIARRRKATWSWTSSRYSEAMGKPARGKKRATPSWASWRKARKSWEDYTGDSALDAGLAASAQAVEHYEIARYGTLRTWADELGMRDASKLLDQTLQEEIKTDQLLTKLATSAVNRKAA